MPFPRALWLAMLLGLAAMASSRVSVAGPLPLPPVPPRGGPADGVAPRPDPALAPPPLYYTQGPSVAPTWFGGRSYSTSQGYIPGSEVEVRPNNRMLLAPGLELRVPLK